MSQYLGFQTWALGNEDCIPLSISFQMVIISLNQEIPHSKGRTGILPFFVSFVYILIETLAFLS